jgi:4-hydroxybenzoate polyprenyltransferase
MSKGAPSTAVTVFRALRAYQWPKNLVVFGALVFAQQIHDPVQVARSVMAFLVLCAASSAVYLYNDIRDIERDRAHPEKRMRPLPSGDMEVSMAVVLVLVLGCGSLVAAYVLRPAFAAGVASYLLLMFAYTIVLKRIMLVDVLAIAVGFVIRAISGALALENVVFSNWLVVCTLFLALFLALGKRRREIGVLEEAAAAHREVLGHYTVPYLDALMVILAATTLLSYTIYTCSVEVVQRIGTDKLYVTLPFVVYGLFRYFYIVHTRDGGGDPSRTLIKDLPLMVTVLLWGFSCIAILYLRAAI